MHRPRPIRLATYIIRAAVLCAALLSTAPAQDGPALRQRPSALLCGETRAVCYSGFRAGQHPDRGNGAVNPSDAEVLEDLKILSRDGNFRLIRLYDSGVNSEAVLRLIEAHALDIKVLLGAWLDAEVSNPACPWHPEPHPDEVLAANERKNAEEIARAIRLAKAYPEIVAAVAVGNEALVSWNDHMVPLESVIRYVRQVKKAIRQPVTVADNHDWWAKEGKPLARELDFVSVHVYPVWEGQEVDDAVAFGNDNMKAVRRALPGSDLVITEAGWATTASEFGDRAGEPEQKRYFEELFAWAEQQNVTTFFFEAFDESWKGDPNNPAGAEKHWGLFDEDRVPKLVMRGLYPDLTGASPEADVAASELSWDVVSQEEIDRAIERGLRWLVGAQEVDGGWRGPHPTSFPAGMTGLALYTLLKTGMAADHRVIRKGLAYMNSQPCEKTYAVGTNLLAYSALPAKLRPKKRVRRLTKLLIETLDDDGWRYNRPQNNVVDLSNGQYAILGLRAAVAMGEKVPNDVWTRAAAIFMRLQGNYGGFGYKPKTEWADAGMTAAGTFCLAVCREQLSRKKAARGLQRELNGRIERGISWFTDNWSVSENLIVPAKNDKRQRWLFHYLYGLERLGALTGLDLFGGHDWYDGGAAWLVEKQGADGAWGTAYGEWDVNTSLALLFLARGTRTTVAKPRVRAAVEGASAQTLVIRTDGKNPALVWIARLEKKVRERLDAGERVVALAWDVNGEEVSRVVVEDSLDVRAERNFLKHRFESNGEHALGARLVFQTSDGAPSGEEASTPASVWIDDVEEPGDLEAIADVGKNRLTGLEITGKASSQLNDKSSVARVVDGHHATSWVCADTDAAPWIDLRLTKGVSGGTLKLVGTHKYSCGDEDWARPKDIEVVVNGRKRIRVTLPDDVRRKHSISIGKMRVRRIRVEIKSRYPGTKKKARVGLKEIELHP